MASAGLLLAACAMFDYYSCFISFSLLVSLAVLLPIFGTGGEKLENFVPKIAVFVVGWIVVSLAFVQPFFGLMLLAIFYFLYDVLENLAKLCLIGFPQFVIFYLLPTAGFLHILTPIVGFNSGIAAAMIAVIVVSRRTLSGIYRNV